MAESTSHNRAEERGAGQNYLANRIISISNISRDDLAWNEPCDRDGYELTVISGGNQIIFDIEALDLLDTLRREQLDQLAECIVREFS
jgi:hypothetical protein